MPNENITGLILYDVLLSSDGTEEAEFDSAAEVRTEIATVRKALRELGYNVRTLGLRRVNAKIISQIKEINPDFIFNLCESLYGSNYAESYLAGLFELLKIPYTGSPPFTLSLTMNKTRTKEVLRSAGIPVPRSVVIEEGEEINLKSIEPPFIVKPLHEDGSAGIESKSVVLKENEVVERAKYIHKEFNQPALLEEYIEGREFHVYISGDKSPKVLAIAEIDFSKFPKREPHILSYEAKWHRNSELYKKSPVIFPAEVESVLKSRIEKYTLRAFKELGCRDYARLDTRVNKDGKVYLIEVNANPDISPDGGFDEAAKVAGITYADFIGEIVENVLNRR